MDAELVWMRSWCGCRAGVDAELVWMQSWCGCRAGVDAELVWMQSWCGCRAGVDAEVLKIFKTSVNSVAFGYGTNKFYNAVCYIEERPKNRLLPQSQWIPGNMETPQNTYLSTPCPIGMRHLSIMKQLPENRIIMH